MKHSCIYVSTEPSAATGHFIKLILPEVLGDTGLENRQGGQAALRYLKNYHEKMKWTCRRPWM